MFYYCIEKGIAKSNKNTNTSTEMSRPVPMLTSPSTTQPYGTVLPSSSQKGTLGGNSSSDGGVSYASPLFSRTAYPGGDFPSGGGGLFKPYPGVNEIRSPGKVSVTTESNEYPIMHYLVAKPWLKTQHIPIAGDKSPFLPHELQARAGDILFTIRLEEPEIKNQHKTATVTLAKLNEILAQGYMNVTKKLTEVPESNVFRKKSTRSQKAESMLARIEEVNRLLNGASVSPFIVESPEDDYMMTDELFREDTEKNLVVDKSNDKSNYTPSYWPSESIIIKKYRERLEEQEKNNMRVARGIPNEFKNLPDSQVSQPDASGSSSSGVTKRRVVKPELLRQSGYFQKMKKITELENDICEDLSREEHWFSSYRMYYTLSGILNTFNFFGVVNNTGDGTKNLNMPTGTNTVLINCVMQRQARAMNIWGANLTPGTTCFLIIKKIDPHGPFQVVPWCSIGGDIAPPIEELEYTAQDGLSKHLGHAIQVGTVQFNTGLQAVDKMVTELACGITSKEIGFRPIKMAESLESKTKIPFAYILVGN